MDGCLTTRGRLPNSSDALQRERVGIRWARWLKVVRCLRPQNISLIQCHSLAALPSAVALKQLKGIPLIYDAHELETERAGWGLVQKAVARILERSLIDYCDHTFAVSDSILNWYRERYGVVKMSVLRNVPQRPRTPVRRNRLLRDAFGIRDDELVFL